nr:hypothetical protein [Tanacetum cinerariifolium]
MGILLEPTSNKLLVGNGLFGPSGRSGGFWGKDGSCGGNGRRGGSIARRVSGSLSKRSMESNDGLGGEVFVVGGGRGEVMDGGVDFRVSRSLLCEILREIMGDKFGEEFRVDGGVVW